jgi:hypothetical protein
MKTFKFFSVVTAILLGGIFAGAALAAPEGYKPGIEIVLEVRTPQGELRIFQRPGAQLVYWNSQDFPIVRGDKVTVTPLITTGEAELEKVRIRLDNNLLSDKAAGPWKFELNTNDLTPGYHLVEVWAQTKLKKRGENSVNQPFLIVPQNDALVQLLQPNPTPAAILPPAGTEDEARLASTIRATDPGADKTITETSNAKLLQPVSVFVSAAPAAKEFFYTLTRNNQVSYTSPRLPILTHILLSPGKGAGDGLAPGEVIFTVRAGDGQGHYGPPAWITLEIPAPEKGN